MIWNKLLMVRWFALLMLSLLWVAGTGCTPDDDNEFTQGDDDDDDDDDSQDDDDAWDGCPGSWTGMPDGWDLEDSAAVALMAQGGEDFEFVDRNFSNYQLRHYEWNPSGHYAIAFDTGFCFENGAGLFQGDEAEYDDHIYSVSVDLETDDGWGGTIQVLPTSGMDPYPLGEPGTVRGFAIEGDQQGGFLVCGSTKASGENSIIWLDDEGAVNQEFPLEDGSCYDLAQAEDGTYWVTDDEENKVYNFDLEDEEQPFTEIGDLPFADSFVVEQLDNDTLMVGAGDTVYTMDIESGDTQGFTALDDSNVSRFSVSALRWSDDLGRMTAAITAHDYSSPSYYGPNMSWAYDLVEGSNPQGLISTNSEGWAMIDFLLWDLTDYDEME